MKLKSLLEMKFNASCSNLSFDHAEGAERTAASSNSTGHSSMSSLSYYFSSVSSKKTATETTTTTKIKIKKSVSFDERCKLRRIPSYPSKAQVVNASWYDDGDYKEFKKDCVQMAGLADRLGKRNVEATGKFTCWGLEALTSSISSSTSNNTPTTTTTSAPEDEVDEKNRRRNQALNLVLDEQERQWKVGKDSPSKIRAVVKPVSSKSAKEAQARGRKYARDKTLKSYLKQTENDDSTTFTIIHARSKEEEVKFFKQQEGRGTAPPPPPAGRDEQKMNLLLLRQSLAKKLPSFRRRTTTSAATAAAAAVPAKQQVVAGMA